MDGDVQQESGNLNQDFLFELNDYLLQQGHTPEALETYTLGQYLGYVRAAIRREEKQIQAIKEAQANARARRKT